VVFFFPFHHSLGRPLVILPISSILLFPSNFSLLLVQPLFLFFFLTPSSRRYQKSFQQKTATLPSTDSLFFYTLPFTAHTRAYHDDDDIFFYKQFGFYPQFKSVALVNFLPTSPSFLIFIVSHIQWLLCRLCLCFLFTLLPDFFFFFSLFSFLISLYFLVCLFFFRPIRSVFEAPPNPSST
jgi:hypothetical protein